MKEWNCQYMFSSENDLEAGKMISSSHAIAVSHYVTCFIYSQVNRALEQG